uniref:Uncharacterized protein n=1 Tax=Anopheles arabiensis TaxID=7173 RepID=A0A182IFY1_ANOAR
MICPPPAISPRWHRAQ